MKNIKARGMYFLAYFLTAFLLLASLQVATASLIMQCPPNKNVNCTEDLYNLSRFGNATYKIGYLTYSAGMPEVTYNLNMCQVGYIKRTWRVEDPYWNWHTCSQFIYVASSNNNPLQINWPPDYEVEGCNPDVKPNQLPAPYNSPTWSGDECRLIGKSYTDMVFTVNKSCKKIMRTWKLIDWCDNNGFGTQWTHNQIIKIINDERPLLDCPKDVTVNAYNCKNAVVNVPPLQVGATSCGGSAVISNNSPYSTNKGADISGTYPIGTTKVTYTIQYGCGSRIFCHVNVIVKNAAAPTPYCFHSIVTTLMPIDTNGDGTPENGMVDVWAKDLDRGSKSGCNYNPLRFSFSPDPTDMVRTFTCDDLGENGVMMFVTDSKGGQSACMVNVIIQNNSSNIPDCKRKEENNPGDSLHTTYNGLVADAYGDPIADADISLRFDNPDLTILTKHDTTEILKKDSFINASGYLIYFFKKETVVTVTSDTIRDYLVFETTSDASGWYSLDSLPKDKGSFRVSAFYENDRKKGIDGKDVEWLTKFLLGEIAFDNAYQYLAADVDGNKEINLQDLNLLISFVTNDVQQLPGRQWLFVDKKIKFTEKSDILNADFDVVFEMPSVESSQDTSCMVGIKKGDIVKQAAFRPTSNEVEDRTVGTMQEAAKIYPNPSSGQLYVICTAEGLFSLRDIHGRLVLNEVPLKAGNNQIGEAGLSVLSPGVYHYTIKFGSANVHGVWVKW